MPTCSIVLAAIGSHLAFFYLQVVFKRTNNHFSVLKLGQNEVLHYNLEILYQN